MLAGKKESLVAAAAAAAAAGAPPLPAALRPFIKWEQEDEQPEDPVAALLLLAGLADDGGPASVRPRGARPASAHRSRSGNSSGGSADTLGALPSGDGVQAPRRAQRARRASAKRRRVEDDDEEYRVAEEEVDEEETEDEEMMGAGSGDEAEGGQLALALVNGAAAAAAAVAAADAAAAEEAAMAAGEGTAGGEGVAPPPKRRPSKPAKPPAPLGQRKYVSSQITISILEQEGCFNMTQVDAARHLGFGSSTVLKKVMRRLGIKQWPYRKRTSAKKITCSLEEYMRKYGDPAKVDAVLERVRMELAVYEASPTGSIPLRPELAALRQRLYKLDNKVKHEFKRDTAAENALRQCVQSLVEKTWQELQPSWMSDLARQPPLLQPLPDAPAMTLSIPVPTDGLASAFDCGVGNGFDAAQAVMLAMLMAQGMLPQAAMLMPGQHSALSDLSAATAQLEAAVGGGAPAGGQAGEPTPQTQQMQGPAASPEEAAAMVAALAPEPAAAAVVKQEEGVQPDGEGEGRPEIAAAAEPVAAAATAAALEPSPEEAASVRVAALAPSPAAAKV